MHAIGPVAGLSPEMIAMDVCCPGPTPYGAYPNAESTDLPMGERPDAGDDPPAISAIGRLGRFWAGRYWLRIGPGESALSRHDGIDWDRAGSVM